jgi:tetratricopeptide (TPR) repeat protein
VDRVAAAVPDDPAQAGKALVQDGRPDLAVPLFEEALRLQPGSAETEHNLGVALARLGKLEEAIARFQESLRLQPDYPDAHGNLALACLQTGRTDAAIDSLRQLVGLRPGSAEAHHQLGNALRQQGSLEDSVASYREAVRLNPRFADAFHALGLALARLGRWTEAEGAYRETLQLKPDHPDARNNLGIALQETGKLDEAVTLFREALRGRPESAVTLNNLGVALAAQNKIKEATAVYEDGLRLEPDYVEVHNNLGNALREDGRLDEAVAHYQQALRLRPDYAEAYNNLGNALRDAGDLDGAAAHFLKALRINTGYAEPYNNLGITRLHQGRLADALLCYEQALQLKADYTDAHKNRALAWLAAGDYENGWPEYEWRWRGKELRPRQFQQPRWDGSALAGRTILLHGEQGLGDTLQFIRYALLVKQRDGRVIVECPRGLCGLLSGCPGVDEFCPQGPPLPAFDVHCPLLSLPAVLRTTLQTVPALVPYLFPRPELLKEWHRRLRQTSRFKIGIAWQGSPQYRGDRQRSIPLEQFLPLAHLPGVELISLQKGPGVEQLGNAREMVVDFGAELDAQGTFLDTAAIMKNIDLVITADTATGHLAGALGVPVWIALCFASDWRWLRGREDSPWYPTVRLFRQHEPGAWSEVFTRLTKDVKVLLATRQA